MVARYKLPFSEICICEIRLCNESMPKLERLKVTPSLQLEYFSYLLLEDLWFDIIDISE